MRCTIVPPYLLRSMADQNQATVADRARRSLDLDHQSGPAGRTPARPRAAHRSPQPRRSATPRSHRRGGGSATPTRAPNCPAGMVRREGEPRTGDAAVDEAYDGLGRDLAAVRRGVRPGLHRRTGPAAAGDGALRRGLRQRLLGRRADGLRRRRRRDASTASPCARRDRARADPRRHRAHRRPRLLGPVRRAERVDVGRLRLAGQAARARPDRRRGGLADRRRAVHRAGARA